MVWMPWMQTVDKLNKEIEEKRLDSIERRLTAIENALLMAGIMEED